jgi:hypothetical protein
MRVLPSMHSCERNRVYHLKQYLTENMSAASRVVAQCTGHRKPQPQRADPVDEAAVTLIGIIKLPRGTSPLSVGYLQR